MFSKLSKEETNKLKNYKYSVIDDSLTTWLFNDSWNILASKIPKSWIPNWISASGFLSIVIAFIFRDIPVISGIFILIYQTLDALDGKHARNQKLNSPIGELIDHSFDAFSTPLVMIIISNWLGFNNLLTVGIVNLAQIFFLKVQYDARIDNYLYFSFFSSGEFLTFFGLFGFYLGNNVLNYNYYVDLLNIYSWNISIILTLISYLFFLYSSRLYLDLSSFNILLLSIGNLFESNIESIISYGAIFSGLACEAILCKMIKRNKISEITIYLVVLKYLLTNKNNNLIILLGLIYNYYICKAAADSLDMSLWRRNLNIYVDGVFDCIHYGHMTLFEKAKNITLLRSIRPDLFEKNYIDPHCRVIVGVPNDNDNETYKRPNIYNLELKIDTLNYIKNISDIIPNAPGKPGELNKDFINNNKIYAVVHGDDASDELIEKYYKGAIDCNNLILTPRESKYNISTSQIIKKATEIGEN